MSSVAVAPNDALHVISIGLLSYSVLGKALFFQQKMLQGSILALANLLNAG